MNPAVFILAILAPEMGTWEGWAGSDKFGAVYYPAMLLPTTLRVALRTPTNFIRYGSYRLQTTRAMLIIAFPNHNHPYLFLLLKPVG